MWLQSACTPRDPSCRGLFEPPLAIPSFVTYNEDDTSVTADETRALIARLATTEVVARAKGGHAMLNVTRAPAEGERLQRWMRQFSAAR